MFGMMQTQGLMISSILTHAARHHGSGEVVSRTHENTTHRYTWCDVEARSRRLVRVMQTLGVGAG
ncbi:MAG: 3-(methylthio)propionyl---CoA ligase, partial [Acetobacteraceae bacterium]|nr:3-(methylthio)propionyl---CoA ligase [Acetobacteraceae bacterium]